MTWGLVEGGAVVLSMVWRAPDCIIGTTPILFDRPIGG